MKFYQALIVLILEFHVETNLACFVYCSLYLLKQDQTLFTCINEPRDFTHVRFKISCYMLQFVCLTYFWFNDTQSPN